MQGILNLPDGGNLAANGLSVVDEDGKARNGQI
jgi:hypothetical protein